MNGGPNQREPSVWIGRRIPPMYQGATAEGARDREAFGKVMDADLYDSDKCGQFLFGPSGSGKSTAGYAYLADGWRGSVAGWGCTYVSAVELAREVRASAHAFARFSRIVEFLAGKPPMETDEALSIADGTPAREFWSLFPKLKDDDVFREWAGPYGVLIDDLHIPKLTPAYSSALFEIVDGRVSNRTRLIITSQLPLAQLLKKWVGDALDEPALAETARAIVRRIADNCIPIRFRWESPAHKAAT